MRFVRLNLVTKKAFASDLGRLVIYRTAKPEICKLVKFITHINFAYSDFKN